MSERELKLGNVLDEYIGVTELKNSFPKRLAMLESGDVEHIFILKHNRPVAVVLSLKDWEELNQVFEDFMVSPHEEPPPITKIKEAIFNPTPPVEVEEKS